MRFSRFASRFTVATLAVLSGLTFAPAASGAASGAGQIIIGTGFDSPNGVAVGPHGDIYVADTNNKVVVKVAPDGTQTDVGSGFSSPTAVAVDSSGNVYVADSGNGDVVKVAPNGTQTQICPSACGWNNPVAVAVDAAGDVFVADTGLGSEGEVLKVTPTGTESQVGSGFNAPYGVAVDSSGNVYVADFSNSRVVKVAPNGTMTDVGSGLSQPDGVAVDAAGDVFVVDYNNNDLNEITPGGTQTQLATNFSNPSGVAVDATGNLYVADTGNNQIVEVPATSQDTIGSGFQSPSSVAVDPSGNVFVTDSTSVVKKITPTGIQSTVATGFTSPVTAVAADAAGNLYVADASNRVIKVAPDGTKTVLAPQFTFQDPDGLAVDSSGNVYVADAGGNEVVEIAPNGGYSVMATSTSAPGGVAVDAAGDVFVSDTGNDQVVEFASDGTETTVTTSVTSPMGLAVDSAGNLYIADQGDDQVLEVAVSGQDTGDTSVIGSGFSSPNDVAVDAGGNVFVADTGNSRIARIRAAAATSVFVPESTPTRVLDTRYGTGVTAGAVPSGGSVSLSFGNVSAVELNVTVTQPTAAGYVTVYPDGADRPLASNLNFTPGLTVANAVIVPVGSDGKVDFYNGSTGTVQILADLAGTFAATTGSPTGGFTSQTPTRILDTRVGTGAPAAAVGPGATLVLPVAGASAGVSAVVLNVTVTQPTATGYVTAYADGTSKPLSSNLNFTPGQTVPNVIIAPVGADGSIDLYNSSSGTVELIADISGFLSGSGGLGTGSFVATAPTRLFDSRDRGTGGADVPVCAGCTVTVPIASVGPFPSTLTAVVVNVTATQPTAAGYVTVYPDDTSAPLASSLNFTPGDTVPNLVVVPVINGSISLKNASTGTTEYIVDAFGYFHS